MAAKGNGRWKSTANRPGDDTICLPKLCLYYADKYCKSINVARVTASPRQCVGVGEKTFSELIVGFVHLYFSVDHILMEKQLNISQCCKLIFSSLHTLISTLKCSY